MILLGYLFCISNGKYLHAQHLPLMTSIFLCNHECGIVVLYRGCMYTLAYCMSVVAHVHSIISTDISVDPFVPQSELRRTTFGHGKYSVCMYAYIC